MIRRGQALRGIPHLIKQTGKRLCDTHGVSTHGVRSCNPTVTGFSPAWQAAINPAQVLLDRMLRETEDVIRET